jgi:exosortase F-associated protein
MNKSNVTRRWVLGLLGFVGLIIVYLFQKVNLAEILGVKQAINQFLVNRSIRFFLNDLLTILLIYSLFGKKKYVVFSIWVQLIGMFLFLIPYFYLRVNFPTLHGPMINFLHRLIMNPILLLLLIPAFYFQQSRSKT